MFDSIVRRVPRRGRRSAGRRPERAATLAEYALIVAMIGLPGVAGLDMLRDSASDEFNQEVSDLTPDQSSVTSSTTTTTEPAPPSTTTTTSPLSSTTTTTSPPSSTTTSTTTTTTPPTTTTAAPPTTEPPSSQATTSWGSTFKDVSRNQKEWTAGASTTVVDGAGQPVGGAAVTVRIEHRVEGGQWAADAGDVSATTAANGVINVQSIWYDTPKGGQQPVAEEIRFVVVSVTKPGVTVTPGPPVVVEL